MERNSVRSFSGMVLAAGVLLLAGFTTAHGAVFTVSNSCDGEAGCLRSCIQQAADGDEIVFDPALDGQRLCMACGEIVIDKRVTITGRGEGLTTLAGDNKNRVFVVQPGGAGTEISGVNIEGGWGAEGSGILVTNHSDLTVRDSNISGNYAWYGGGGIAGGYDTRIVLINTTVHGNMTSSNGGGIYVRSGEIVLRNSTVSGNFAWGEGGGIYGESGRVRIILESTTVTGNDTFGRVGGVFLRGEPEDLQFSNSIIANQVSGDDCAFSGLSLGHNLDSDWTCGLNAPTDQAGVDPMLHNLGLSTGSTYTHVPMAGSPVIDRGICQWITDQRGVPRPRDGNHDGVAICDIGSVEYNPRLIHARNPVTGEDILVVLPDPE